MKIKYVLTFLIAFSGLIINAQSFFEKTFGSPWWDAGYSVLQTKDSGFVFTGIWNGYSSFKMYLIKTNKYGDLLWNKSFVKDSSSMYGTKGYAVIETNDGGFAIAGSKWADPDHYQFYFVKTDKNGDSLIGKTYGADFEEQAYAIKQTTDGGFIMSGTSGTLEQQFCMVRINEKGDKLWTNYYGFPNRQGDAHSVVETNDGGFALLGYIEDSYLSGLNDIYLSKTNGNGDLIWRKKYGGSNDDVAYSIQKAPGDGFIIAGTTHSYGVGGYDMYLIRTDSLGEILWTKTFGGLDDEWANAIAPTSDGGYIVAGSTQSYSKGGYDAYLVKVDSAGNEKWHSSLGGLKDDYGYGVQQTFDGGYIMVGIRNEDIYLVKIDGKGNVVTEINVMSLDSKINVYPNPFSSETIFKTNDNLKNATLAIYNTLGQEIKLIGNISGQEYKLFRDDLQSGIYFYRLTEEGKVIAANKLVITD
jgi:hypothetical protein